MQDNSQNLLLTTHISIEDPIYSYPTPKLIEKRATFDTLNLINSPDGSGKMLRNGFIRANENEYQISNLSELLNIWESPADNREYIALCAVWQTVEIQSINVTREGIEVNIEDKRMPGGYTNYYDYIRYSKKFNLIVGEDAVNNYFDLLGSNRKVFVTFNNGVITVLIRFVSEAEFNIWNNTDLGIVRFRFRVIQLYGLLASGMTQLLISGDVSNFYDTELQQGLNYNTALIMALGSAPLIYITKRERLYTAEFISEDLDITTIELSFNSRLPSDSGELGDGYHYNVGKDNCYFYYDDQNKLHIVLRSKEGAYLTARNGKRNNSFILKNTGSKFKFTDCVVKNYESTPYTAEGVVPYEKTASYVPFFVNNPEWIRDNVNWNGKEITLVKELDSWLEESTELYQQAQDPFSSIKQINRSDPLSYSFYDQNHPEKGIISREYYNPELPGNNQAERELLFYVANSRVIEDGQGGWTIVTGDTRTTQQITYMARPEQSRIQDLFAGDIATELYDIATQVNKGSEIANSLTGEYNRCSGKYYLKSTDNYTPEGIFALTIFNNYIYALGTYTSNNVLNAVIYRTVVPGTYNRWLTSNKVYFFQSLTRIDNIKDVPLKIEVLNNLMYICGRYSTQVWRPNPATAEAMQQGTNRVNIFGEYISTLNIGAYNPNLIIGFNNLLLFVTKDGIKAISPFMSFTGIPGISGETLHKNVMQQVIRDDELFDPDKSTGRLSRAYIVKSRDNYMIGDPSIAKLCYLQCVNGKELTPFMLFYEKLKGAVICGNADVLTFASVNKDKISLFKYCEGSNIYADDNGTPIDYRITLGFVGNDKAYTKINDVSLSIYHESENMSKPMAEIFSWDRDPKLLPKSYKVELEVPKMAEVIAHPESGAHLPFRLPSESKLTPVNCTYKSVVINVTGKCDGKMIIDRFSVYGVSTYARSK